LFTNTKTLTALCHTGDVVIGGYTQANNATGVSGDTRSADIFFGTGTPPAAQVGRQRQPA
jgi:hypothetical protein